MNPNFLQSIFKNKLFLVWIVAIIIIAVGLSIFRFGMLVGFSKADFSCHWGENYHRNFGMMPPRGGLRGFDKDDYVAGAGAVGSVIHITSSTIMVRGSDNTEKSILITPDTMVRRNRDTITLKDIKLDDRITVIGVPSTTGQIEAKFIRIFNGQ